MLKWVSVCTERTVQDMGILYIKEWFKSLYKCYHQACSHGGNHSRVGVQAIDACLKSRLSESVSESSCATDGTEKS